MVLMVQHGHSTNTLTFRSTRRTQASGLARTPSEKAAARCDRGSHQRGAVLRSAVTVPVRRVTQRVVARTAGAGAAAMRMTQIRADR